MAHQDDIARKLAVLGHPIRLAIVRLLVRAGPTGVAAGALGRELDTAPNALTFHLQKLAHAGLVNGQRNGQFIVYRAEFDELLDVADSLVGACCADSREKCGPRCPPGADESDERGAPSTKRRSSR